ncbi:N-acetylglucosamine-6-phosphate deacetylase-like [Clytia hemisphaerica]|uniref:N-acetylglucosamine-6-phosphate deacetylase n=1 Tax=Clytia hemisphaerica TaxID=252671 RepID=A0A7M5UMY7_9CNID|eukprot:TCONS_00004016-protein
MVLDFTGRIIQFINCRILYKGELIKEDFWVRDGIILNPEKVFYTEREAAHLKIDCKNLIISPGFIDVQINGGFGFDFSSDVSRIEEARSVVSKELLQHGVTSYCPTIVTSPPEVYKQVLPYLKPRSGGKHGAEILGAHLEGPFISKEKKGAHDINYIKSEVESLTTIEDVYGSLDDVSIITVAPELSGMMEVLPKLVKKNISVSIGHSVSDVVKAETAFQNGASFITHLFNAMLPFHHRDPGIVGLLTSALIPKSAFYGMIADGIHTHPTSLRIAYRTHPKGIVLVTDAIVALGLPPGIHKLGTMDVEIFDKDARILGTNTLAGSICSMDNCVRHFKKGAGCTTVEALEAATLHPAQLLGIETEKGTLDYNSAADFIFLSDDLRVQATFIAGLPVYVNNDEVQRELSEKNYL